MILEGPPGREIAENQSEKMVEDGGSSSSSQQDKQPSVWQSAFTEDLQRTTDSALSSARSIQHQSSNYLRAFQVPLTHLHLLLQIFNSTDTLLKCNSRKLSSLVALYLYIFSDQF